ncbi:MAG: putative toxin-antitoxin system toxin component, PIN family [Terracidiphilus sp.]|nr:putative toxin-antitoxin system toxin component, PIN family [Terracidiphilus sp.]
MRQRIVVDTNVYVSRLIRAQSTPGRAVGRAWSEAITLVSTATLEELRRVLRHPKLARYIQPGKIDPYLVQIAEISLHISNPPSIRACRDPRDDKFLEVAVHGRADGIVTGNRDLLELAPFRGIAILTPAAYLELK